MRRLLSAALGIAAAALLMAGCSRPAAVTKQDLSGKTYVYENDGFGGDFTITLNSDGTFEYYEGLLSSYIGMGDWTLDGDTVQLNDTGMGTLVRTYRFHVEDNALVYAADTSDAFLYLQVADGDRFTCDA